MLRRSGAHLKREGHHDALLGEEGVEAKDGGCSEEPAAVDALLAAGDAGV